MSTAVIGGGVVGLNIAWSLRRRGEDVTVIEASRIGQSVSAVNAGWVTPSLSTPLASPGIVKTGFQQMLDKNGAMSFKPRVDLSWVKWLWKFSRAAQPHTYERGVRSLMRLNDHTLDLFDELRHDGVEFEMHQTGILALARQVGGLKWFTQLFEELKQMGFKGDIQYLSVEDAQNIDPAVGPQVAEVAHTQIDRFVDPNGLLFGLAQRLRTMDVEIKELSPVHSLSKVNGRWRLSTPGSSTVVDNVIVALGASTNRLLKSVNVKLPIMGAKGYSVELRGTGAPPRHAMYLMESKLGLSPLERGVRLAGFFELPGSGSNVPQRRVSQLIEQTRPYMGGWQPDSATISEGLGGLRPATSDSLPFIGPVPGHDGLHVATGHGMLGVTLAPATAEAISQIVLDKSIPETVLPFQLAGRV